MLRKEIMTIEREWILLSKFVFVPQNEEQYDQLVAVLNALIDNIGGNETHPLASLMDVIGALVEQYEDEHIPEITDLPIPVGVTQIEDE